MKKLVLFGAGNIGRSFIGQLFSRSGYEVVFIDIVEPMIEALNKCGSYNVIIKSDKEEIIKVNHVRGVLASDKEKVAEEVSTADIIASCVGNNALPHIIPLIAEGLAKRYKRDKNLPLDIIIALNMRDAAEYFEKELSKIAANDYPLNGLVGLVETSIGKMVPIMTKEDMETDILQIFAEPYNNLILDKKAFKNPIPDVKGLSPKDNMKAWVDRKLFIHNLGHVSAAYCGFYYYPDLKYMHEILGHDEIRSFTREAMLQSSRVLDTIYPGVFTSKHFQDHIEDLISRFRNKALGDTVFRVGCDLQRKLGSNDRLLAPFHAGIRLNIPVDKISEAICFGTHFSAKDEKGHLLNGDAEFIKMVDAEGLKQVMKKICNLDEHGYEIINKQFVKYEKSKFQ
ncbi:MAG: mannitol-1-phosphate 5-dehydrogenase [Actinomycetia bacterium]|nr:mannitol-1-phosphate 5-dehydrogenase [Actinomycetes bacterium]